MEEVDLESIKEEVFRMNLLQIKEELRRLKLNDGDSELPIEFRLIIAKILGPDAKDFDIGEFDEEEKWIENERSKNK